MPQGAAPKFSTALILLLVAYTMLGLFGFIYVSIFQKPLRVYESALVVMLSTMPIWIGGGYWLNVALSRLGYGTKLNMRQAQPLLFVAHLGVVLAGAYYLNAKLDTSQEQTHRVVVSRKDYSTHKNSKTYYAAIPSYSERPLTSIGIADDDFVLDREEHIRLSRTQYDAVQPGATMSTIVSKQGFFGIPWVVRSSVDVDTTPSPEKIAALAQARGVNKDLLMGLMYSEGRGVTKDERLAVKYFEKAASVGDANGQYSLAYMYSLGRGGLPQDWVKANELLLQAAEQGHARAMDDLGVSYGDGRGITQDWVKSYMWITLSARRGEPQAQKDVGYAEARMTPAQIEEAKRLADVWESDHPKASVPLSTTRGF